LNGFVLGGHFLNPLGDKLFYLLRRGTGPGTTRDCEAHWDIRIFALGHRPISKPTPGKHAYQQHPGNLRVLDEKPREIVCPFDNFLIAFDWHFRSAFKG
jgi:hypothetical protein